MKTPEILAPAGSSESLLAAVRCGADAVYLGTRQLNARRSAANFDEAQLLEAVSICHTRGVKVYLTLNTVVFDGELPTLVQEVENACAAGVDAVLVQDLATVAVVRACAPDMELHASTQMSIHNLDGAKELEQLGFSRVVLARELSLAETRAIAAGTSLALECFVHGALCMCVSGQCYLSSMIGGRSGNRGMCAQPCRLPFASAKNDYALSLKDLSLIPSISQLVQAGVSSLKIEGRMKRPEYVAAAVTACRQALDGQEPDFAALEAVFSRSGFTSGYFDGKTGAHMFGTRQREDVVSASGVLKQLSTLYKDERQSVPVDFDLTLVQGKPVTLTVTDRDGNVATASGSIPQQALTAPTDEAKAAAALQKTGGTLYTVRNISTKIDEGLMVPASKLNALRREALESLTALRAAIQPRPFIPRSELLRFPAHTPTRPQQLRARVGRHSQITSALLQGAQALILPAREAAALDADFIARHADKLIVEIPRILFNNQDHIIEILQRVKQFGVTDTMAGSLGGIQLAKRLGFTVHGDYSLNVTNSLALAQYGQLGLHDLTVSFELELRQITVLGGALPRGMLAYGHLPLMATRNCPIGDCAGCDKDFPVLTDRLGNRFFVDCDCEVSNLYNCVPLFLADRLEELSAVDFLTLYFTKESPQECADILRLYQNGGTMDGDRTRGLYYRKVL